MLIIMIMIVFLEHLSKWNMLSCTEQVQIPNYSAHAHDTQNSTCPENFAQASQMGSEKNKKH